MTFKLPGRLERTILGITSSLIIAGTPIYARTVEAQTTMSPPSNYSIYINNFDRPTQEKYNIPVGRKDAKEIFLQAKKEKEPISLEIIFGVNETEEILGKEVEAMNLTPLDPGFSRFILIYPKKVEINTKQEAYIISQKKFIELIPLSETKFSKRILKWGENLLDSLTPFFVVNPVKDLKDYLIESSLTKEEKIYYAKVKKMEKEFGEDYTFKKIEFFGADKLGDTERVRKIKTFFDTKELEGTAYVVALLRPAIGNSSSPDKRGTGEWIEINFSIQGKKMPYWIKKQEMGAEIIPRLGGVKEIIKKRSPENMYAYDPSLEKLIIYSYDKREIEGDVTKSLKVAAKMKSLFLSIEQDLIKERFSNKGIILVKEKNSVIKESVEKFYEGCREIETK